MGAAIDATSLSLSACSRCYDGYTTDSSLNFGTSKRRIGTKPSPKKKRRNNAPKVIEKVIDPVLESRREAAKLMMRREGITQTQEQVTDKRKRCQVCFKLSDFQYQNVPHTQFGKL